VIVGAAGYLMSGKCREPSPRDAVVVLSYERRFGEGRIRKASEMGFRNSLSAFESSCGILKALLLLTPALRAE